MLSSAAARAQRESIFASFLSSSSKACWLLKSSVKLRSTEEARWVWQLMRPGMATMPVPSMTVFGGSLGAVLLKETIFPCSMPM